MRPHRTRIKICGLTRPQDVQAACAAGADAIGFVFYPKSSRLVSLEQAAQLRAGVPALVSVVVLFVNASESEVREVQQRVQPELLQFHGDESPEYCASFGQRYVKAFRVGGPGLDTQQAVLQACRRYPDAAAWLFDRYRDGYGRRGLSFDPALLGAVAQAADARPVILAGGLKPDTVAGAIRTLHPYAVDVSSGVEVSGGIKSEAGIQAFVQSVRAADMG